jgi:hypothetical protein
MQRRRTLATLGAGLAAGLIALGASPALSETARAAGARAPDLTGVWTNAWYTKLERPKVFKGLVATQAEAEAYETPRRALHGELASKDDAVGQNESEFPDNGPGLARIRGELRSSWIVDPADGRIPWITAQKARLRIGEMPPETYDNVEERDTDERCLTASGSGVPMINAHDANLVEIVQSPGWVAILMEKNHETRFVRIQRPGAAASPPPAGLGAWMGVSIGHWDGPTLVVETTGFRPGFTAMHDVLKLSDRARVVERFTRTGPAELAYEFEVTDPTLFTRPWRAEMVFRPAEGQLFEYACHEGNYSLPSILAAARTAEREKAAAGAAKPAGP